MNNFTKKQIKKMDKMCNKIIDHQIGFKEYISDESYDKLDIIREAFKELVKTEGNIKATTLLLTDLHSSSLIDVYDVSLWSEVI